VQLAFRDVQSFHIDGKTVKRYEDH